MELHSVTLHGHRVGLRLAGDGPVLLLVHGMASSSAAWMPVGAFLASRFTIVAPDLLGHGQTATPPGDYSLGAHATLLRDLLLVLGHVIGIDGQRVSANDRLQLAADLPTLIVWGAGDPIIPVEHARRAHAAIVGSRLEIFEDVGHFPHCEAPERFARTVSDFVASTEPARLSQQQLRARLQALPS